ncbi:hypothetical protein [Ascidiaceihabitans sp.]|uniref:hypothetical protein n=1 Tax=Ascidiaceihabitans sp. TaxID=1872644 RepID=UPI003297849C
MSLFGGKWADVPDYILGATKEIWEDRRIHRPGAYYGADMAAVSREYDRAVMSFYPGGDVGYGRDPVDQFWMSLRASFLDAIFKIDHAIGRHDPSMPPRAALHWSLSGTHSGWGLMVRQQARRST